MVTSNIRVCHQNYHVSLNQIQLRNNTPSGTFYQMFIKTETHLMHSEKSNFQKSEKSEYYGAVTSSG